MNSATCSHEALAAGAPQADQHAQPTPTLAVSGALLLLRAYKLLISPLFTGSCRFVPSCSDFAAQAIREHGLAHGTWLAARRLGRCHPFCAGGYDPVPPRN